MFSDSVNFCPNCNEEQASKTSLLYCAVCQTEYCVDCSENNECPKCQEAKDADIDFHEEY